MISRSFSESVLVVTDPSVVEIPMAKVIRGTARYIVKVSTADGRQWAVAKRFSEFFE